MTRITAENVDQVLHALKARLPNNAPPSVWQHLLDEPPAPDTAVLDISNTVLERPAAAMIALALTRPPFTGRKIHVRFGNQTVPFTSGMIYGHSRNRHFTSPECQNGIVPVGPWRYCWRSGDEIGSRWDMPDALYPLAGEHLDPSSFHFHDLEPFSKFSLSFHNPHIGDIISERSPKLTHHVGSWLWNVWFQPRKTTGKVQKPFTEAYTKIVRELMTNVNEHAARDYPPNEDPFFLCFAQLACYKTSAGQPRVRFTIADNARGLPALFRETLKPVEHQLTNSRVSLPASNTNLVKHALLGQIGFWHAHQTRHRGTGLPDIGRAAFDIEGSELLVLSNQVRLLALGRGPKHGPDWVDLTRLHHPSEPTFDLHGTVVTVSLPLPT